MHTSPFISFEPILLEVAKSSEECNLEDTLKFCENERSSLSSTEFEHPSSVAKYVVLIHDLDTTPIFHDAPLEMENQHAMEYKEPTLASEEKDSTHELGSFSFEIPQEPCSFNTTI